MGEVPKNEQARVRLSKIMNVAAHMRDLHELSEVYMYVCMYVRMYACTETCMKCQRQSFSGCMCVCM
jgi:hypothetical protein